MFFILMVDRLPRGYARDRLRAVFLFPELSNRLHAREGRKTLLAGWRNSLGGSGETAIEITGLGPAAISPECCCTGSRL
jgi:hypothetical protein